MTALPMLTLVFVVSQATPGVRERTISISGEAGIKVAPNQVTVVVGVESFDAVLGKAKKVNDDALKQVIAAARAAGVEEKNVSTDSIRIEPEYVNDSSTQHRRQTSGYFVQRTLQLVLGDVKKFDGLLSAVVEAGANVIHNVSFTTTELRKHRDRARELAMKAANEKAVALATQSGMKLSKPISISEGSSGWYSAYGSRSNNLYSQNVSQNMGGNSGIEGTGAPGMISVTANVSIVYELE